MGKAAKQPIWQRTRASLGIKFPKPPKEDRYKLPKLRKLERTNPAAINEYGWQALAMAKQRDREYAQYKRTFRAMQRLEARHVSEIALAALNGEPIPDEVLSEYPSCRKRWEDDIMNFHLKEEFQAELQREMQREWEREVQEQMWQEWEYEQRMDEERADQERRRRRREEAEHERLEEAKWEADRQRRARANDDYS